ncbi:MAG: hypothetical protein AAF790_08615, partial [Planctomycetota bacterium]
RYVPAGHADPLLRAWIDLAASLGPDKHGLRDAVLAELAGPGAAGGCITCHSIERDAADTLRVNWRGLDASQRPRSFTKFSHRPHLTQPVLQDCSYCHRLDPGAPRQPAPYASLQTDDFVSQFLPVTKDACAVCHQPRAAGDSCTQCHNYHVQAPAGGLFRIDAATQNRDTPPWQ